MAFLIYNMLQTAHPTVVEMIEYQAAQFLIAGNKMAEIVKEASQTEEGRRRLEQGLQELRANLEKPGKPVQENEEDD